MYELCFYISCSPDAPKNVSVSVSVSGVIEQGSSVTLTCSSDANPPEVNYTWFHQNEDQPKATGQNYTIAKIQPDHSGNYTCSVQNTIGVRYSTFPLVVVAGNKLTDSFIQLLIHPLMCIYTDSQVIVQ